VVAAFAKPESAKPKHNLMDPSPILELNAFVPAKDFGLSKQFYSDLGFTLLWGDDGIAQFQAGSFTFLLQNFHAEQHSANFMMSLMTEDADAWWKHIERVRLKEKYPRMMLKPPALQPWGIRVLYLSDPTGVLWHIADRKKA
jgi:Glyoxalase/Bleomycin resistance protein/Dioxygenase superfamily